jgi:hypothetical protein
MYGLVLCVYTYSKIIARHTNAFFIWFKKVIVDILDMFSTMKQMNQINEPKYE